MIECLKVFKIAHLFATNPVIVIFEAEGVILCYNLQRDVSTIFISSILFLVVTCKLVCCIKSYIHLPSRSSFPPIFRLLSALPLLLPYYPLFLLWNGGPGVTHWKIFLISMHVGARLVKLQVSTHGNPCPHKTHIIRETAIFSASLNVGYVGCKTPMFRNRIYISPKFEFVCKKYLYNMIKK